MTRTRQDLAARLGLDVPKGWWPTAPMLKGIEAAGFGWTQVHSPPVSILVDRERSARHAAALRTVLDACGLRVVIHGPDQLSAGTTESDRAVHALLGYAVAAGAEYVVYHGANFALRDGGTGAGEVRARARDEERALRRIAPRLQALGLTLAVENLAPVWPGAVRLCHDPGAVLTLVRAIDSPRVTMLFDVGHAAIAAGVFGGGDTARVLAPLADVVGLYHLHDNLGARCAGARGEPDPGLPGVDPLRLDLHLPPGAGRVPWYDLAPLLCGGDAPLILEVRPPHRPEPVALARVTTELLLRGASAGDVAAGPAVAA